MVRQKMAVSIGYKKGRQRAGKSRSRRLNAEMKNKAHRRLRRTNKGGRIRDERHVRKSERDW